MVGFLKDLFEDIGEQQGSWTSGARTPLRKKSPFTLIFLRFIFDADYF